MRLSIAAASVSWIPSEVVSGFMRPTFDLGVSHYDQPPPDRVEAVELDSLSARDAFRFANRLAVWADVEDGMVRDAGYEDSAGLVIGLTSVHVGPLRLSVKAGRLPSLRRDPERLPDGGVRLVQTAGGRTGFPLPRPVSRAPFVQWRSPVVWTTLALTIRPDGDHRVELIGASGFPRHWVYGPGGDLVAKSGLADMPAWMDSAFGERTPWGDYDSPAVVAEAVSDLERSLSDDIMRGARPEVRRLRAGEELVRQGDPGRELYLVLDGLAEVAVDGTVLGQVGPGAVLGERALLEGGVRTATVTASTNLVLAVAPEADIDLDRLRELARTHRREER